MPRAQVYWHQDVSNLKLTENYPKDDFRPVLEPRGSVLVEGFWSHSKFPDDIKKELGEFKKFMNAGLPQEDGGKPGKRPASASMALATQARPNSAVGLRARPGTAPPTRREKPKKWNVDTGGQGLMFHTKSARELREEFGEKQDRNAMFSRKHLIADTGLTAEDLCIDKMSEASTEAGATEQYDGDSDDSELEIDERIGRAKRREKRFMLAAEVAIMEADKLREENAQQAKEVDKLNKAIEDMEEEVELLKDGDTRWREKNSALRIQRDTDLLLLEQARMNRCDLEDRCRPLDLFTSKFKRKLRRWGMSWDLVPPQIEKQRDQERMAVVWLLWKSMWEKTVCEREAEAKVPDMEQLFEQIRAGKARIRDLQEQLEEIPVLQQEKEELGQKNHELNLLCVRHSKVIAASMKELNDNTLEGRRRYLRKYFDQWMVAWPSLELENIEARLQIEHEELKSQYILLNEKHLATLRAIEEDTRLIAEKEKVALLTNRVGVLQEDVDASKHTARTRLEIINALTEKNDQEMRALRESKIAVEAALRNELRETEQTWRQRCVAYETKYTDENIRLREEANELEAQVDDLREALHLDGDAGGDSRSSRLPRPVPRTQGVLCAGCLTQILHRDVQPIQSYEVSSERLEQEKVAVYKQTIGRPTPDDTAHAFLWSRRKDPPKTMLDVRPSTSLSRSEGTLSSASSTGLRPVGRPRSAIARAGPRAGRAGALREEVAGFRRGWQG